MTPCRILIDDDDAALCAALAEVLSSAGYDVAADAAAGYDVVLTAKADFVGPGVALVKPLRMGALLAAIEAACCAAAAGICLGDWRFDAAARLLTGADGVNVRLTDKETAVLDYLAKAGAAVERDVLLSEIWGYGGAVSTHTLETHIYTLRQKIEADPTRPLILLTEPGGYRLIVQDGT